MDLRPENRTGGNRIRVRVDNNAYIPLTRESQEQSNLQTLNNVITPLNQEFVSSRERPVKDANKKPDSVA
jgi:hypothetical protein